ncbi:hypothetical protein Cal7507_1055 [Calothrix sp. PCC 7507]|nr:hypothetical protein Cal7507_1055 [Calothrix sp. PCC 7507]
MRDCSVSVSLTRAFRPALPKTPQNKIDKPLGSAHPTRKNALCFIPQEMGRV